MNIRQKIRTSFSTQLSLWVACFVVVISSVVVLLLARFSQVGYTPDQPKVAVIELDKNDQPKPTARLVRIGDGGTSETAYEGSIQSWGAYFKYNYVKFDFSSVTTPGVYYIEYGKTRTNDFLIDEHVYDKITDATTDVWVPIHMNHMYVTEGYRTWHGEPFKEGYLQAPESDHFDLHSQGKTTDTKYKPYELIPGLNIGGFFDAGDTQYIIFGSAFKNIVKQ